MKADHINCFYIGTRNVFSMMLGARVERGQVKIGREVEEGKHIGVLVEIEGRLNGCVYYIFPKKVALSMVEHMAGMKLDKLDTFVSATLVEIVDKVNKLARNSLKDQRKKCNLSDPLVVSRDMNKVFERYDDFISIPIKSEIGDFDMNIFIN